MATKPDLRGRMTYPDHFYTPVNLACRRALAMLRAMPIHERVWLMVKSGSMTEAEYDRIAAERGWPRRPDASG